MNPASQFQQFGFNPIAQATEAEKTAYGRCRSIYQEEGKTPEEIEALLVNHPGHPSNVQRTAQAFQASFQPTSFMQPAPVPAPIAQAFVPQADGQPSAPLVPAPAPVVPQPAPAPAPAPAAAAPAPAPEQPAPVPAPAPAVAPVATPAPAEVTAGGAPVTTAPPPSNRPVVKAAPPGTPSPRVVKAAPPTEGE